MMTEADSLALRYGEVHLLQEGLEVGVGANQIVHGTISSVAQQWVVFIRGPSKRSPAPTAPA